jgi:hypothetical protein
MPLRHCSPRSRATTQNLRDSDARPCGPCTHSPRTTLTHHGPKTLTAVETTGRAGNINRHSNPLAGPATPMQWRQPARRNTLATRQAWAYMPLLHCVPRPRFRATTQILHDSDARPCGPCAHSARTTHHGPAQRYSLQWRQLARRETTQILRDSDARPCCPAPTAPELHTTGRPSDTKLSPTAVETTGLAGNINRHSNPPAGPATPMRWRQSARRNTPI